VLLTVVIPSPAFDRTVLDKVRLFVAETQGVVDGLRREGIPAGRIELVHAGVDLSRFAPAPLPPDKPFRLVFASTPADSEEFEARGIPLLIELARHTPEVELLLLWRRWGSAEAARRALDRLRPPANVTHVWEPHDLAAAYNRAHAVACFFADGFGKSCPNSVIEALACGRPALVADTSGIADVIRESGAGVVVDRTVEGAADGLLRLRRHLADLGRRARAVAERYFDVERTVAAYRAIYDRLATGSHREGIYIDAPTPPGAADHSVAVRGTRADL
jgi:glycosyltransferase involved in cell wall biosynthesis